MSPLLYLLYATNIDNHKRKKPITQALLLGISTIGVEFGYKFNHKPY
jgi:hypothetical protein